MKKTLLISAIVLLTSALCGTLGVYFLLRGYLRDAPAMAAQQLARRGILMRYANDAAATQGLSVHLRRLIIDGKPIPYALTAKAAAIEIGLGAWPPLRVTLTIVEPKLRRNENYEEPLPATHKPTAPLPSWKAGLASFILALARFEAKVTDASLKPLGIEKAEILVRLNDVILDGNLIAGAHIEHGAEVQGVAALPWIPSIQWTGRSRLVGAQLEAVDHQVSVGPFASTLRGRADLNARTWSGQVSIPETDLSAGREVFTSVASNWIKGATGKIRADIQVQGVGAQTGGMHAEGRITGQDLRLDVDHPSTKGTVASTFELTFNRTTNLSLTTKGMIDFSAAELREADKFRKPAGVPCVISWEAGGEADRIQIVKAGSRFHNLSAEANGELLLGDAPSAKITFRVPSTPLAGWEQFFPKYAAVKTQGSLQVDGTYSGPVREWQTAAVNLLLRAKNVRLPILPAFLPTPDLKMEGIVTAQSETRIEYESGKLKQLSTDTQLDLREAAVAYTDRFRKPSGTPFSVDLSVASTRAQAQIKRGNLVLAGIRGRLQGNVENFDNPVAHLKFVADKIDVRELLAMSPATKLPGIADAGGALSLNASLSGPLLSANSLPDLKGGAILENLRFEVLRQGGKKIRVTSISGPIAFTSHSVSGKKVKVTFPSSDAVVDFNLESFEKPDVSFLLWSSKIATRDFYEPLTVKEGASPGLVAVPVTGPPKGKSSTDFRDHPLLKELRLTGSFNVKALDLGWTKAEAVSGRVQWDKLLLKLQPLKMKILGGEVSYVTEWDGRVTPPAAKLTLKAAGVDANQFIGSFSERARDVLTGKLRTDFSLQFAGMTPDEIVKSSKGQGDFTLSAAELRTMKFSREPLQQLQKLPRVGAAIQKTEWEEKINESTGFFSVEGGRVAISNLVLHGPLFDAVMSDTFLDQNQNIQAKVSWTPKPGLLPTQWLDALKDTEGKPAIPLLISGPLRSPAVAVDGAVVEERVKNFLAIKAQAEARAQLKKQVPQALKKIFK